MELIILRFLFFEHALKSIVLLSEHNSSSLQLLIGPIEFLVILLEILEERVDVLKV